MKKILACLTVSLFFVMIPIISSAKKPLTENEMDTTTAQEGVTIEFGGSAYPLSHMMIKDRFAPELNSWGDNDGCSLCGGFTSTGWVGTTNVTMDPFVTLGNGTSIPPQGSFIALYSNMTIDVGSSGSATKTFIGLPGVLVHPSGTNATLELGATQTLNEGQVLGTTYNDQFALVVNTIGTGVLAISNHSATGREGLDIEFCGTMGPLAGVYGTDGVMFSIPNTPVTTSWGDSDGCTDCGGYGSAGYFGAKGLTLGTAGASAPAILNYFNIKLSGTMTIDVGSDAAGKTAVIIGLPTTTLYNANIYSPMTFATNKELTADVQSLGTSYIGNIKASPSGSITISAH